MEKVRCVKCGSIGYTASPETVKCGICGSSQEVIDMKDNDLRIHKPVTAYLRRLLSNRKPPEPHGNKMSIVFTGV